MGDIVLAWVITEEGVKYIREVVDGVDDVRDVSARLLDAHTASGIYRVHERRALPYLTEGKCIAQMFRKLKREDEWQFNIRAYNMAKDIAHDTANMIASVIDPKQYETMQRYCDICAGAREQLEPVFHAKSPYRYAIAEFNVGRDKVCDAYVINVDGPSVDLDYLYFEDKGEDIIPVSHEDEGFGFRFAKRLYNTMADDRVNLKQFLDEIAQSDPQLQEYVDRCEIIAV